MEIKTLETFVKMAREKKARKLVVAAAGDRPVLEAVCAAQRDKFVTPILVGDADEIGRIASEIGFDLTDVEVVDHKNPIGATKEAVGIIREGRADFLMKGLVGTADLLRAVLDKDRGLRKGAMLSHIAFFECPTYHKLLSVTDAAMNVAPDFKEKISIIQNGVEAYHKLGIGNPKVAVIGAVEVVNEKMEATVHAAMLTAMNRRKQIKGCIIDGPLALDNAVSAEACEHKGIVSEVGGDADMIMCPDIEAANVLYKSLNFLGGAIAAAVIMGAAVPIVLTSRADSDKSKLMSIALAAAMD